MDIQLASNFERYLYYLLGQDAGSVRGLMEKLAREGGFSITSQQHEQVKEIFTAVAVGEDQTLAQIRSTYEESGYILDPHTAVGVKAAEAYQDAICLATAHPAKFRDAVKQAIGVEAPPPPSLRGLMEKETRCAELEASSDAVQAFMQDRLLRTDG